ncbi:MAG: response regulator transcription factor [Bacillati bacterium ANGP1]|uniref:Response regulator transcription factor n=1 Tax=Candidatus Segetimicrobium genomatis TaxID=2569760 RepID=A0A537JI90_9BACT|nr:MAG: response regulator transcription factor [Terrabacteria group bacterium ANGP1]
MIRILIVDDHPVVREGLVAVLGDDRDFRVVGTAGSAEEAVATAERARPDVVLLDLEMPGTNGVEAIPKLRATAGHPRVLVLTAYDTEERVLGALRAGAGGYLLKGAAAAEIAQAIRAVHEGGSYLTPRVAARVVAQVGDLRRSGVLSGRERQVLRLVAQGLSNKQIARQLAITERTVKFHMTSIFNKLGAENRAQAIAVAAERGLL